MRRTNADSSQVKFIFQTLYKTCLEGTAKDHSVIFEAAVPYSMLQNTAQKNLIQTYTSKTKLK